MKNRKGIFLLDAFLAGTLLIIGHVLQVILPIVVDYFHEGFYDALFVCKVDVFYSDFYHHSSDGESWINWVVWKGLLI